MKNSRVIAIAAAALVAGLVLGTMSIATAAPAASTTTATAGVGARLGGFMRTSGATLADIVAKLTGISVDDVRADRQDGKSFAAIAESKGVSSDKVVSTAIETRQDVLAQAVKDGRITQAQADTMLANMKTNLSARVSSTAPGCTGNGAGMGGGRGMGGGGRGAGACGGGACGACTAAPTN